MWVNGSLRPEGRFVWENAISKLLTISIALHRNGLRLKVLRVGCIHKKICEAISLLVIRVVEFSSRLQSLSYHIKIWMYVRAIGPPNTVLFMKLFYFMSRNLEKLLAQRKR